MITRRRQAAFTHRPRAVARMRLDRGGELSFRVGWLWTAKRTTISIILHKPTETRAEQERYLGG